MTRLSGETCTETDRYQVACVPGTGGRWVDEMTNVFSPSHARAGRVHPFEPARRRTSMKSLAAFAALTILLAACTLEGGQDGDDLTEGTSAKPASTASACTDGEYRCANGKIGAGSIEVCRDGAWEYAAACGCGVKVGDPRKPPYRSSCSLGSTKGSAVCSYAGESCRVCRRGEASCTDIPQ
jgi:hypothetical protein